MSFQELKELLIQVVVSWQVIAVTVAVILYCSLVSYVAKLRYYPRSPSMAKIKKEKVKKTSSKNEAPITTDSDDLGLEEG